MMRFDIAAGVLALMLIGAAGAASAENVLPLPPPAGAPNASVFRDARIAIERAAASNPAAARNAAFTYDVAIRQYNAHNYAAARLSALTALGQAGSAAGSIAPVIRTPAIAPVDAGPLYFIIPDEAPPTESNARQYVASTQRAMTHCIAPAAADVEYRAALAALKAKHYQVAMSRSRNAVDICTGN